MEGPRFTRRYLVRETEHPATSRRPIHPGRGCRRYLRRALPGQGAPQDADEMIADSRLVEALERWRAGEEPGSPSGDRRGGRGRRD
jgi:hypothetical protein